MRRTSELSRYLAFVAAKSQAVSFAGSAPGLADLSLPWQDLFIPPLFSPVSSDGSLVPDTCRISDLFSTDNRLLIFGAAGAGKTALLAHLSLEIARSSLQAPGDVDSVPVRVPLAPWYEQRETDGGGSVEERLCRFVESSGGPGFASVVQKSIRDGTAVVLLDALDEVAEPAMQKQALHDLEMFGAANPSVRVVVTSRRNGLDGIAGFASFELLPWNPYQVHAFVHRWSAAFTALLGVSADPGAQAHDLLLAIGASPSLRELSHNPLFLTMIVFLHRQGYRLPARRVEAYGQIVRTMLARGAATLSPLDAFTDQALEDMADEVLAHVAWRLALSGSTRITASRLAEIARHIVLSRGLPEGAVSGLVTALAERTGLLVSTGESEFEFIHVSFQEFFAAKALTAMGDGDALRFIRDHSDDSRYAETIALALTLADSRGDRGALVANATESLIPAPHD